MSNTNTGVGINNPISGIKKILNFNLIEYIKQQNILNNLIHTGKYDVPYGFMGLVTLVIGSFTYATYMDYITTPPEQNEETENQGTFNTMNSLLPEINLEDNEENPEENPAENTEENPAENPENSEEKSENSEENSENSEEKSEEKPEEKPEENPTEKSDEKSEENPAEKSDEKKGGKTHRKKKENRKFSKKNRK